MSRASRATGAAMLRANLTAKRELLIEAVRAWADSGIGGVLGASITAEQDLREAWREFHDAEKKANGHRSRVT